MLGETMGVLVSTGHDRALDEEPVLVLPAVLPQTPRFYLSETRLWALAVLRLPTSRTTMVNGCRRRQRRLQRRAARSLLFTILSHACHPSWLLMAPQIAGPLLCH